VKPELLATSLHWTLRLLVVASALVLTLSATRASRAQNPAQLNGGSQVRHNSIEAHLGRGYAALKNDRFDEAAGEFRNALELDSTLLLRARFPLAMALFELHQAEEARREFETVRRDVGDHPNIMYYLGRLDLSEGKFHEAIEKLTKASDNPPFPDTSYYLGYAYMKQGDIVSAEKWLREAARLDAQDSRVQYQLGVLYRISGRQNQAQAAFSLSERLREREEENGRLGMACNQKLDQGSLEGAQSVCEQLFDPNDPQKLAALGTIYGQHGFYEEATKPLRLAADLSSNSPQMQYNLALAYFRLKQYEDARVALAKAVKQWQDLFELDALYGAVLYRLGEQDAAYSVLNHAHELDPQNIESTDLLYQVSMLLARQNFADKKFTLAVRYLGEAAELRQREPEPHRLMAEIFSVTGDAEQAEKERRQAEHLNAQAMANP